METLVKIVMMTSYKKRKKRTNYKVSYDIEQRTEIVATLLQNVHLICQLFDRSHHNTIKMRGIRIAPAEWMDDTKQYCLVLS